MLKSKYGGVECGVVWCCVVQCSVCAMYVLVDMCGEVRRMKRRTGNITATIGRNINNDCLQSISFSLPPLLPFLPISPPPPSSSSHSSFPSPSPSLFSSSPTSSPSQTLPSSLSLRPTSPSHSSSFSPPPTLPPSPFFSFSQPMKLL